ncbi:hypothetical protein HMPREF1624_02527 [Sporothrix schenckii ATCC 58251]|uniref:ML-like domain-containing protein n=1 Tax=Sporothrix schenckii (strain ATCC 58251 / de Perez 2211183) TaxID=1391915 RepID=U7Q2P1_SPOS1|nr:hypothetical protein HMPREF1624_02527 [Sporothrix schenckii ATCC 58251]
MPTIALRNLGRPTAAWMNMLATMLLVLLACIGIQPARAVSVQFENCMPEDYVDNTDPVLLQWVPLLVEASFDATANDSRKLLVTMYGNVTGTRSSAPLPAWDSPLWNDPSNTNGKILRAPDTSVANPKLTTLHSKMEVLTYEPWSNDTDFCADSLTDGVCPLGPVFNTSVISYTDLPSVSMSNVFTTSYAFTSFSATFIIRYGDAASTTIGCVSATITPSLGYLAWIIKFLPLLVLLVVGFATVFAGMYSPWGTADIFHWTSNYGRDPDLLRLVTPGFGDCLQYLQFAVLTGGLTLSYPGFYQPIVSQASWSALMFNQTFVSKEVGIPDVVDGIYSTNGSYGLQNLGQLAGMANVEDIWAGMMVWLMVIVVGTLVLFQLGFALQWIYRSVRRIPEEDLRSKNWPFSVGNLVRVVFNYFLLPLVSLSTFQFVVATQSPAYTVALAALTLAAILGFAAWLLYLITSTKPRAVLFDDLPTLLLYGPLYNTYSDEAAAYAMCPFMVTLIRGIAIGAVQPAGIAQIILLAICEVVQIVTLQAILPFHKQSSMNAYHTLFAALRFVTIMLMIAFIPALGVTEGPKGWIGYVILVIHAGILILGFFLNAIQTLIEVIARMAGAGGDDVMGQTRGGLSKIFGMRQLSRRMPRRIAGATSRQSQMSNAGMLDSEEASKAGFIMPGGRLRSESAGSIGVLMGGKPGQRSSSALDNLSVENTVAQGGRNLESGAGSYTPTTAGEMSNFSFLPSPNPNSNRLSGATALFAGANTTPVEASDPYYRQPRRTRRPTLSQENNVPSPANRTRGSWASGDWGQGAQAPGVGPAPPAATAVGHSSNNAANATAVAAVIAGGVPAITGDGDVDGQPSRGATPAPYGQPAFSPRTDYSTREVDFYYGVRGQRLNSDAPGRRLGTGPADPTGPMASAAGWFRTLIGGKTKEKGKGFEVVRSSRMPPAMVARGGDFEDEGPPPGVPVAMDVIRNGPIESDDEDDAQAKNRRTIRSRDRPAGSEPKPAESVLLNEDGNPGEDSEAADEAGFLRVSDVPPLLPSIDGGDSIHMPSRLPSRNQSKASRYTAAGDGYNNGVLPSATVPVLAVVPSLPRKSSKRPLSDDGKGQPTSLSTPSETGRTVSMSSSHGAQYQQQPYLAPAIRVDSASSGGGLATARLPFDRNNSLQRQMSEGSSNAHTAEEFAQIDLNDNSSNNTGGAGRGSNEDRPTSYGYVQQGSISRIDPERQPDLLGSSAEVIDERH